ncbi:MAG: ribose 5-phosphate isomerase A [Candidatus Bathyarchaeota archaeon]|nr:ribose 5-phosphate isomerase A [Candidatus Bathyarchaeota archaeon]MDH5787874.1 ribose 5-phosphate isomerase A [Candidatus Bathyarchaeota archaeon]
MNPKSDWIEKAKKAAACEAVKHVKNGFVVGLGSGSTAAYAVEEIGKRVKREKLHILGVPTSYQALMLAIKHRISITMLEIHSTLDLTIDGADQIDKKLNLIKGMGGALTREKIVAAASTKLVIVADETKKVKALGEDNHPVPIEVLPMAVSVVMRKIREIGGKPTLREGIKKVGPVITDNGNIILDANFGLIRKPAELENKLRSLPGVVETGLFVKMANLVYLGKNTGVEKIAIER